MKCQSDDHGYTNKNGVKLMALATSLTPYAFASVVSAITKVSGTSTGSQGAAYLT